MDKATSDILIPYILIVFSGGFRGVRGVQVHPASIVF